MHRAWRLVDRDLWTCFAASNFIAANFPRQEIGMRLKYLDSLDLNVIQHHTTIILYQVRSSQARRDVLLAFCA